MSEMEMIRNRVATMQMLATAITTVQRIQNLRTRLHGPSSLNDYNDQLDNLLSTLWLVKDEPELHTGEVQKQSQRIVELVQTLLQKLDILSFRLDQNGAKSSDPVSSQEREERDVDLTISQLESARKNLTIRICSAPVGLQGKAGCGFIADAGAIKRVDQKVTNVLGERLSVACAINKGEKHTNERGRIVHADPDTCASDSADKVSWVDNEAFDNAVMFNTDFSEKQVQSPSDRLYKGNKAHGTSTVVQGRAGSDIIATIMLTRPL